MTNALDFMHWFNKLPKWYLVLAGGAVFGFFLLLGLLRRPRQQDTHGSARFATPQEVRQAGLVGKLGFPLGQLNGTVLRAPQRQILLCAPSGCHAPGTAILMADGTIKTVEGIQIHDQLMGPDSLPRTVTHCWNGVAELALIQPIRGEAFTVTFDHVLVLKRTNTTKYAHSKRAVHPSKEGEVIEITVKDWLQKSRTFQNIYLLHKTGVEFPPGERLPLHPYVLGAIIGDGYIARNSVEIINNDPEVKDTIHRLLVSQPFCITFSWNHRLNNAHHFYIAGRNRLGNRTGKGLTKAESRNPLITLLKELHLHGKTAATKFLPHAYKTASKEDRLWLLAGLIDTDGTLAGHRNARHPRNYCYSSKSAQLAHDVCFVARSLGLAAFVTSRKQTWQNGQGVYYTVSVYGNTWMIPCQIPRKQVPPDLPNPKNQLMTGFTVTPQGIGRYYGFSCTGDQRYLMGDFTITHNSRKDRSHNFPFTATYPGSLLIVDCKDQGENWVLCRKIREQMGPVYRFAPGLRQSHCYNLLSGVRAGQPEEFRDASVIMQGLMAPKAAQVTSTKNSQFFEHQGVVAGRAVALHLLHSAPPEQRTLAGCRQVMADPEACLSAMSAAVHPEVKVQARRLTHLLKHGERQFSGEWGTAQSVLDLYGDPLIAEHTAQSDFRLTDLQYSPTPITLYLGAESPTDLLYLYPLFRAMLESSYRQLTSVSPQHKARRWPLTILVNEADSLGWMPLLEQAPAHARSYDIWFVMVFQDLEQLFGTYGHDTPLWGTLTSKVFHAPTNDKTAKRLSDMLGDTTVEVTSINQGDRRSRSQYPAARKLKTPAEVLGMGPEDVLVWSQGCPAPIQAQKLPYWTGK